MCKNYRDINMKETINFNGIKSVSLSFVSKCELICTIFTTGFNLSPEDAGGTGTSTCSEALWKFTLLEMRQRTLLRTTWEYYIPCLIIILSLCLGNILRIISYATSGKGISVSSIQLQNIKFNQHFSTDKLEI